MQQRLRNGALTARIKEPSVLLQRSLRFIEMNELAAFCRVYLLQYLRCDILTVISVFPEEHSILMF